jgi:hypothetical protein
MQPSATACIRGERARNNWVTSLRCVAVISGDSTFASWVILRKPCRSPQSSQSRLTLCFSQKGVGGADALVHQFGKLGRLQVPFFGIRADTVPNCIHGMATVSIKAVGCLSPRNVS